MFHPRTHAEVLQALESNAGLLTGLVARVPDALLFAGSSEHWSPAHHLAHLTRTSRAVERGLRSGALPPYASGHSRTYEEMRDAATAALAATPRDTLRDMGRVVVLAPGAGRAELVAAFEAASRGLRAAATEWSEPELDRRAMDHPLIGRISVREMLLFMVVHERHHARLVQARCEAG